MIEEVQCVLHNACRGMSTALKIRQVPVYVSYGLHELRTRPSHTIFQLQQIVSKRSKWQQCNCNKQVALFQHQWRRPENTSNGPECKQHTFLISSEALQLSVDPRLLTHTCLYSGHLRPLQYI